MSREPATVVEMRRALGGLLKNLRIAAGIKQADLAGQVFRDRTFVSHVESGRSRADERFWQAADRLTCSGGVLLAGFHALEATKQEMALKEQESVVAEASRKANEWYGVLLSLGAKAG